MSENLTLHEYAPSGNCYKIRLLLAHLGISYRRIHYDILNGETRTPEFLSRISPVGSTPVLQVGDRYLPESNAALMYLGDGTRFTPADRFDRADMARWLFWEQYSHEPNIATLRFWKTYGGGFAAQSEARQVMVPVKYEAGEAALERMDTHLTGRDWFVGNAMSLADIALYAYTHVADEGGFNLAGYPAVTAWTARVAAEPGHVPITA